LDPAQLRGDGKGRGSRGDRAGAKTNSELRCLRRNSYARENDQQARNDCDECLFHRAILSRSSRSFSEGSQKRTRRRISRTHRFNNSPTTERISSTENCPETSMLEFMLSISIPTPAPPPTNSATIPPLTPKL